MKKWIKNSILGCLIGCSFHGFSQNGYTYQRKIAVKQDVSKWQSLTIPDELYDKTKSDLSDIRIYNFVGKDTVEVPFLLSINNYNPDLEETKPKIINQTKTDSGFYFTLENLNLVTAISEIKLQFKNENFDWKIDLQGSNNQNEWFTILEDYRILAIKNPQTTYRFENLSFENTTYKYYRIFIKTQDKPVLTNVFLNASIKGVPDFKTHKITNFTVENNKKNKTTVIEFSTKTKLPVYGIDVKVNDKSTFYRNFEVEYLIDSVKIEKGWKKHYQHLFSGRLSSSETALIKEGFPPITLNNQLVAQSYRITIENQDNAPLNIQYIELQSLIHSIYFEAKDTTNYVLFYGNKEAKTPQYDLEKFYNKIINEPKSEARLLDEILISKETVQQNPLFESKLWLWGIMLLIIVILGYFSFKMVAK
ncbi:MAG TPA: DUF3999 family protein [Flavobacterium sp.]|nr:DUF3999 family protein [Flavobacterium sp.]